jgi:hypothetical protein
VLGTVNHTIVALVDLLAAASLLEERSTEQPQDPPISSVSTLNSTTRPATSAMRRCELVERCGGGRSDRHLSRNRDYTLDARYGRMTGWAQSRQLRLAGDHYCSRKRVSKASYLPPMQAMGSSTPSWISYGKWLSAAFIKGGTQSCASAASAVWEVFPTSTDWRSGLAAGWRLSLPGLSRSRWQSPLRPAPIA